MEGPLYGALSDHVISKLTTEERDRFDSALDELTKCFPIKTLFTGPLGPDATIEIRVSRWPRTASDIDGVIAILQAIRQSFPEALEPATR